MKVGNIVKYGDKYAVLVSVTRVRYANIQILGEQDTNVLYVKQTELTEVTMASLRIDTLTFRRIRFGFTKRARHILCKSWEAILEQNVELVKLISPVGYVIVNIESKRKVADKVEDKIRGVYYYQPFIVISFSKIFCAINKI